MKKIPYAIAGLVLLSVSANGMMLFFYKNLKTYFLWVNLFTGVSLVAILGLSIYAKKQLKKQQAKHIHNIFSKN